MPTNKYVWLHICPAAMIVCLLLCAGQAIADLSIVSDGQARAVILIPDDPSPVVCEAADELARVIEKASGARLLIYPESEYERSQNVRIPGWPGSTATRLAVGNCQVLEENNFNLSELPPEGFIIKTVGNAVILAGRDEPHLDDRRGRGQRLPSYTRGTWHAVCAFLEDYVGARWLWPGQLGEVIPATKNISVGPIDRTGAPALISRTLRLGDFYNGPFLVASLELGVSLQQQFARSQQLDRWADHQRLGSSLTIASTEFTKDEWLDEFAADHPDWFALQPNGRRLLSAGDHCVRMCLSNPGVIDEVVRRVVAYLDAHPNIDGYGIAPSDVYGSYCVCPNCQAWGPTISDLVAHHVAAVAQKVAELRPGKLIHGLAYHKYVAPPQSDVVLPDNVVLSYVGIDYFGYLCDTDHQRSIEYWDGWAKIASKMIWRPNNFCLLTGVPRNYTTKLGQDFHHFYQNGMIGVDFDRLFPNWAIDGLNYYVVAHLCWDPTADVVQMVDDYCQKGFGPAAPAVHRYFAELEKLTNEVAAARPPHDDTRPLSAYYSLDQIAALHTILDEAEQLAAGDATVQARIAFLREGLDFAEIEVALGHAVQQAKQQKPSPQQLAQIRNLLARRQQLCQEHAGSWAVDVAALWQQQPWLQEQLFAQPEADIFDDLPNAYNEIMQLPQEWKFHLDPQLAGEQQKWFAPDYDDSDWANITVGDFWENQGYKDYDGAGWYRTTVQLPADLAGQQIELCFGAADEVAHVWVNGTFAGAHDIGPEGWNKRFNIDITSQAKPGQKNLIVVRVIDSTQMGGLWKPIKVITPKTTLIPIKDAWLRSNFPDTAYGKNPSVAVGADDWFRSVFIWQLPENLNKVTIRSARVVLPLRYHTGIASYLVYLLAQDFYEPKVNWNTTDGATAWPGGAGATGALAGAPVTQVSLKAISEEQAEAADPPPALIFDATALLRYWADQEPPHGLLLVQNPPQEGVVLVPHSREADKPALRPRLEFEYTPAR